MSKLTPDWIQDAAVRRIFAALGAPAVDVRAVGGSVRDAVRGVPAGDVDIGTPEAPDVVMTRLTAAGVRVIPTGLSHGTVTAVIDGRTFEITSLRRDTACDGRHAAVEFTTDWHEDARRRDFTFNAMSLSPDGTLHDDHGGADDARAGRLRFVGNAADRIQEDYLRILRLFRFQALVGAEPLDPALLDACAAQAGGLARLSAERVQSEMAKLLAALDPAPTVRAMQASGVLSRILPVHEGAPRLARLIAAEVAAGVGDRVWLRRLAAVIPPAAAADVAEGLKLSNADRAGLLTLTAPPPLTPAVAAVDLGRALHDLGATPVRDRALLGWSAQPSLETPTPRQTWLAMFAGIDAWVPKPLPVGGADVLALGIAPGPRVGQLLAELLDWWLAADRHPDRAAVLRELKAMART